MPGRFWKIALSIGLFIFIALTLSLYLQLEPPAPTGPYTVGRTIFRWVDISRPEVMTDDPNDFREVMALVWYPAEPGTGVKAGYIPDFSTLSSALMQSGELQWWEVSGLKWIRSESALNAKPVREQTPFPVILLSPGNATNIEFYSVLAGEIASHGYIVVGLNHPYDVPAVQLSDGEIAPYDKEQWLLEAGAHQIYTAERMPVRVADLSFALDQLEIANSDENNLLAGIMDLDSVAAAGHSLGGIAASEACKADARFSACLNFDGLQKGGPFSMDETMLPPSQPFLFLTKEDQLHPKILEGFESTVQSYWVTVHGASHDSFTDGPLLRPSLLLVPNQADMLMRFIQQYTLAFLDQTLKGQPTDVLSESADREDVSVRVFPSR